MKVFEVSTEGGKKSILAKATTRAGLAVAALQGFSSVSGGSISELDEKVERDFSVEAEGFSALLAGLLNQAGKDVAAHGESYDDIRFTLITEKKAEGAFIGRPSKGAKAPGAAKVKGDVARNEAGEWEATVVLG